MLDHAKVRPYRAHVWSPTFRGGSLSTLATKLNENSSVTEVMISLLSRLVVQILDCSGCEVIWARVTSTRKRERRNVKSLSC